MMVEKFLILGTDFKMTECKRFFNENGYVADCYEKEEFLKRVNEYDNIILPLPTVKNGVVCGTDVTIDYLVELLDKSQNLFYGNLTTIDTDKSVYSYYYNESFLYKNSRLTAQGVLKIILDNILIDLTELSVCVLGYGHCSKAICDILLKLGVNLTVFARSSPSKKMAEESGLCVSDISEFDVSIYQYDIIVNTIPCNILSEKTINSMDKKNIYIEIASSPYGFDTRRSDVSGFRYIPAPALPGKYTPISAGKNIAHTVLEILKEVKLG